MNSVGERQILVIAIVAIIVSVLRSGSADQLNLLLVDVRLELAKVLLFLFFLLLFG